METLTELKEKILEKISEEELDLKYNELKSQNVIFQHNKRMAYHIIATDVGAKLNVTVASSSTEAFPLKISDVYESEKASFNLEGYVVKPLFTLINKSGNPMGFMSIADDTGIIPLTVWSDLLEPIADLGLEVGSYVKVSNAFWKDKSDGYNPSIGKFSSVKKVDPAFELDNVVVNSTGQLVEGGYFTVKGIIGSIPESGIRDAYHCERGHWFKGLSDNDVGTLSLCEHTDCGVPMLVEKHVNAQGVLFADMEGQTTVDISVFARIDELKVMDEFIFTGKYEDGTLKVTNAYKIKKA